MTKCVCLQYKDYTVCSKQINTSRCDGVILCVRLQSAEYTSRCDGVILCVRQQSAEYTSRCDGVILCVRPTEYRTRQGVME